MPGIAKDMTIQRCINHDALCTGATGASPVSNPRLHLRKFQEEKAKFWNLGGIHIFIVLHPNVPNKYVYYAMCN